jgi:uncharacterized protein YceK
MRNLILLFLMPLVLTGCATPITHDTPSGKVEVTINGVQKSAVKDELINGMVNKGYTVTRSDDALLVFDRPIQNSAAAFMFSSDFSANPTTRTSYNLIQTGKSVRVVADFAAITNPGSGFEKRTDLNAIPETRLMQDFLTGIKMKMEK